MSDPTDKKLRGIKPISELTDEDIAEMGTTALYLSLNLSMIIYECFMAGLHEEDVIDGVKMLYEEISKRVKEKAN